MPDVTVTTSATVRETTPTPDGWRRLETTGYTMTITVSQR